MKLQTAVPGCDCGSGLMRRALVDARGIFCAYVCDKCEKLKRQRYNPEIFRNANYETSEPIDEE